MEATVSWNTKLTFTGNTRGHETVMDTSLKNGGLNRGPTPKELVLEAMCGCAGMDVISILEKKHHLPLTLAIHASAELTNTTPAIFASVKIAYKALGEIPGADLIRAVELSMTKYCGVTAMIAKACPVTYEIFLNEDKIGNGLAKFEV